MEYDPTDKNLKKAMKDLKKYNGFLNVNYKIYVANSKHEAFLKFLDRKKYRELKRFYEFQIKKHQGNILRAAADIGAQRSMIYRIIKWKGKRNANDTRIVYPKHG